MSAKKEHYKKFRRRTKTPTTEEKIKKFIIQNSKNGYYTKISTIPHKFGISQEKTWEIIGELLDEGNIESTHDQKTGEMKLCETGKTYHILNLNQKRKRQKIYEIKRKTKKP